MMKKKSLLRGLWAPIILFYLGGPDTITLLRVDETQLWTRHLISLLAQGARASNVLIVTWTSSGLAILSSFILISGIIKYEERIWAIKSRTRKSHRRGSLSTKNKPSTRSLLKIEIELGFMYDVLFSKVGTIFTAWGFILRFITLSCVVSVFVVFFMVYKPETIYFDIDKQITIILLLGAIFLEIVGLLLQLVSDWAVVWAWKHQSKLSSAVLFLHEHRISKRERWCVEVGQFSLLNCCTKYEATVFNGMVRAGWRKLLSNNFSLPSTKAEPTLKLIINQLRKRSQENSGQPSQISSMKAAIVLWHLATDICYHSKDEKPRYESEAAKILSYYMMHLLLICPNTLPFCNTDGDFWTAREDIMEILNNQKLTLADQCEGLKEIPQERCKSITVKRSKDLASALMQKPNNEGWEIMSSMWVEMLCYAAKECKLKYHAQELRHGGEFLTHVWLLLMHFGIYGDQERIIPPDLRPDAEEGAKSLNDLCQSMKFEGC
ncbi:uncharacterized protein LOC127801592 [Diospyros lotus]|uniref:uncharacterized protein LOC127801592 n=1 Tax=Diospyros lotus TaxID=55363 RepID=UPI00225B5E91|nr:uncharacterized protein LOC127801592 [Diospyros lotus]